MGPRSSRVRSLPLPPAQPVPDCVIVFAENEIGKAAEAESKKPEELTEEDKMALLGKPKLGEVTRAQIRVKESKEFKVSYKFKISSFTKDHFKISCFIFDPYHLTFEMV